MKAVNFSLCSSCTLKKMIGNKKLVLLFLNEVLQTRGCQLRHSSLNIRLLPSSILLPLILARTNPLIPSRKVHRIENNYLIISWKTLKSGMWSSVSQFSSSREPKQLGVPVMVLCHSFLSPFFHYQPMKMLYSNGSQPGIFEGNLWRYTSSPVTVQGF